MNEILPDDDLSMRTLLDQEVTESENRLVLKTQLSNSR